MTCVLVVLFAMCSQVAVGSCSSPTVQTVQGKLVGSTMETYTGSTFFAFRGVRYAESTAKDHRFKPPVPVVSWGEDVKDALVDGPICPQPYADEIGPFVSEDCLFLNVYTKNFTDGYLVPVMVYFHSGGYAGLTGNSYWEGPQYLLEKEVVLVTINYRLGALGFVSTEDSVLPGNYGMKDQVEALKWVQENIRFFGGDPDTVTIFGYSAGGASVMLHLVSPLSSGLFHRAIAMSGGFLSGWAINRQPKDLATRLANILGCSTTSTSLIYDCLMQCSAEQIVNATMLIKDFEFDPLALFAPVVEPESCSERFLPTDPYQLISTGDFYKVPIITGITRDEFAYRGYYVLLNDTVTNEFNTLYNHYAPIEFMYTRQGEMSNNISTAIKNVYLRNQSISNVTRTKFMEIYTDSITTFSVVQAAQLLALHSSNLVYLYMFDYQGRYSHRYIPGTDVPLGICHHDDLIYLFYISMMFPEFNSTFPEVAMVSLLTDMWTNFACSGNASLPGKDWTWEPLEEGVDRYLRIDLPKPEMVTGLPFPERMAFWESQFPFQGPHQEYY